MSGHEIREDYPFIVRIGDEEYRVDMRRPGIYEEMDEGCFTYCDRCTDAMSNINRDACMNATSFPSVETIHVEMSHFVA